MFKLIEFSYCGGRVTGDWERTELGTYPTIEAAKYAAELYPGLTWRARDGKPGVVGTPHCDCAECTGQRTDDIYPCPGVRYIIEPAKS